MVAIIQIRRDTSSKWTSINPILADGEMGYETDTSKVKVGDGVTHWVDLAYSGIVTTASGNYNIDGGDSSSIYTIETVIDGGSS